MKQCIYLGEEDKKQKKLHKCSGSIVNIGKAAIYR